VLVLDEKNAGVKTPSAVARLFNTPKETPQNSDNEFPQALKPKSKPPDKDNDSDEDTDSQKQKESDAEDEDSDVEETAAEKNARSASKEPASSPSTTKSKPPDEDNDSDEDTDSQKQKDSDAEDQDFDAEDQNNAKSASKGKKPKAKDTDDADKAEHVAAVGDSRTLPWVTSPLDCRLLEPEDVAIDLELEDKLDDSCFITFDGLEYQKPGGGIVPFVLVLAQNEWVKHTSILAKVKAQKVIEIKQGDVMHTPYLHGLADTSKRNLEQFFRVVQGTHTNIELFLRTWAGSTPPRIVIADSGGRHRAPNVVVCLLTRLAGKDLDSAVELVNSGGAKRGYAMSSQVPLMCCARPHSTYLPPNYLHVPFSTYCISRALHV
jgi:hypothetical protein